MDLDPSLPASATADPAAAIAAVFEQRPARFTWDLSGAREG